MKIDASDRPRQLSLRIKTDAPADAVVSYQAHLVTK